MADKPMPTASVPSEPLECWYCAQGWPLLFSVSKTLPRRHSYPKDYKGMRAGYPHCEAK